MVASVRPGPVTKESPPLQERPSPSPFPRFPPRRFRHDRHCPRPTARERRPRWPVPHATPAPRAARRRSERPSSAGPHPGPAAACLGPDARQRGGPARPRRVANLVLPGRASRPVHRHRPPRRPRPRSGRGPRAVDHLGDAGRWHRPAPGRCARCRHGRRRRADRAGDHGTDHGEGGWVTGAGRAARVDRRRLCAGSVVAGGHRRPRHAVAGGGGRRRRAADRRRTVHRPAGGRGRRVGPGAAGAVGRSAVSVRAGPGHVGWRGDADDDRGPGLRRPAHGRRQPGGGGASTDRHGGAASGRAARRPSWPISGPMR